ncbi:MAG TPA: adenylyltransferase/cytidyltransferase family protein [Nitrososphaeraceae archaeon]|nr:adenylyltransferase/cytidyltransferase family protein [Nitrososphaeraceae archaeon]
MKSLDKLILKAIYISNLDPSKSFLQYLQEKYQLDTTFFQSRMRRLIELGFIGKVNSEQYKLNTLGRETIKVVLVGGVFDILHPGHIFTLKAAKLLGDVLVVVIATETTATKIKKNRIIFHNEKLRREMVSSLNFVDLALIGKKGTLFDTVEHVKPDIIALGYDQLHTEKFIAENCKERNMNVSILRLNTPIPNVKSSELKRDLGDSLYNI